MRDLLTDICLVGAAVSFAAYLALRHARRIACVSDWLVRVHRSHLAAFLAFAIVATLCAQKQGGTNAPPNGASPQSMAGMPTPGLVPLNLPGVGGAVSVTSDDVARGFLLESVSTNDSYSYAMPANGTRYGRWWKRGAYEDVFSLDLGEMRFPLGTNLCDSLWVYTWGMAGARLGDASNRIAATGVPMSAVPCASQFWSAALPGGARRLTWQDFALNRDTNTPVSAQLELYPSGDFVARSNLVESVYRRINPDDWDDDGDPNDTDENPYIYDGDFFGPHQEMPEGANSNAYCWVDIVVSNANALVTFTGDGPSALPDPRFIARAGETNRVTILIGKTYTVTCDMPIVVVDKSDPEIEVTRTSANRIGIVWPVEIWSEDHGSYFEMFVSPDFLGGAYSWSTNGCCEIAGSGSFYTFLCGGGCGCDGCSIDGHYRYEGYSLTMFSGECGCEPHGGGENEPAGVGVSFSHKVLFYEDEYYDEALGVTVPPWTGERVALKCSVSGGQYGGVFSLSLANIGKLERIGGDVLPVGDVSVAANETRSWRAVYTFVEHSDSEDDVQATATFMENLSGAEVTDTDSMTVVMLRAVADAFWPTNKIRKSFGVGETATIYKTPSIQATATASRGICEIGDGGDVCYTCPHSGDDDAIVITAKDCSHAMVFNILEPSGYNVINVNSNIFATAGVAGGFEMLFELRVLPRRVSFKNVELIELPRVATDADGYYAQPSKTNLLDHGKNGAGTWNGVGDQNTAGDKACMTVNDPPWLGGGSFTWPVPNAWRVVGDNVDGTIFCNTDQRFELDADGTARLKKFRYTGERMTNGVYRQTRTN
jgi:hypothetical protein